MLKVENLREDIQTFINIINRDRYTYLLFRYDQNDLDRLEDNLRDLSDRLVGILSVEIDDSLLTEILEMCDLLDITEILEFIDRDGELTEIYKYNW